MVISASDAKRNVGGLLNTVRTEPVVIERFGQPAAVLISYERYREMDERSARPKRQLGGLKHLAPQPDQILAVSLDDDLAEHL